MASAAVCVRQKEALRMVETGRETIHELGTDTVDGTWYAWPQPWPRLGLAVNPICDIVHATRYAWPG